jgi:alkane 1-monooxygenase
MSNSNALVLAAPFERDPKRASWALSVVWPIAPAITCAVAAVTGQAWHYWGTVIFWYLLVPLLDHVLPMDTRNPAPAFEARLEQDRYYRRLTYLTVPMHYVTLLVASWVVATQSLPWHAVLGLGLSVGIVNGLAINTGHELCHKTTALERGLARIVLAVVGYGHFSIEHTRGHHRHVATPEDSASARMGESIYRFALREIPGAIRRAWDIEAQRLRRQGRSPWHVDNEVLQPLAITVPLYAGLVFALGASIVPFLVLQLAFAWWQLTSANYVEHYGLLRQRQADGRYEHCQPIHSWNSNHVASNVILFHLQRHSDHHAHPTRRYQSLRAFTDLPELPSGYPAMFAAALCPPLWYALMDARVAAWAGGDLDRVNLDPRARERLRARYHRPTVVAGATHA